MEQQIAFRDCRAERSGDMLITENSVFRRIWKITPAGLVPQTLENVKTGENLVRPCTQALSPAEIPDGTAAPRFTLTGGQNDDFGFALPHIAASLTADYGNFAVRWEFSLYPKLPVFRMRMALRGTGAVPLRELPKLDALEFTEKHCRWESVSIRAVTDSHNNLVQKADGLFYCNEVSRLPGNLLRVHRTLKNDGAVLIREAPALEEQVRWSGCDFLVEKAAVYAVASGLDKTEENSEWVPLYGSALLLYTGGEDAFYRVMRTYWEARRRFRPGFDGQVFSNTWGDDTGAQNIRQDFLEKDLAAAQELGVDQYQIDAGWDTGETDPATGRSLWKIKGSVLPEDFRPICEQAGKLGVVPGVWFVPYTMDGKQYSCWHEDAETLLELYHTHGMRSMKLDGFKLPDYTTTVRFERMLQFVLEKTNGGASFNIDITNWPRTGLFGATQYGNVFLENRYANRVNYYPHYILRNLWKIAPYFPISRIQAEFINTGLHRDLYEQDEAGDALAPERCGQIYSLGCVLFASPLAWMQPCLLEASRRRELRTVLDAVKQAREGAARSLVLPVGEEPDGVNFTGFQAMESETAGWLLVFREASQHAGFRFRLHGGNGESFRFTQVYSSCPCSVTPGPDDSVSVSFENQFSFAVIRYEKNGR